MKDFSAVKHQFNHRRKLLTVKRDAIALAEKLRESLIDGKEGDLRALLDEQHPADLADAVLFLKPVESKDLLAALTISEAAELLDEIGPDTRAALLKGADPSWLANVLSELPLDESADILSDAPAALRESVLRSPELVVAEGIRNLLAYPPETAGGIMSVGYVDVRAGATQKDAVNRFRECQDAEHIFYIYVLDAGGKLLGAVDLRNLLRAEEKTPITDLMDPNLVTVGPSCDQEQVAHIFARYDLNALAVVKDDTHEMLGVITPDSVINVIEAEYMEDIAHITGSDAQELERKSPAQIAKMRMPWILATLFIELLAGVVIHIFDKTLATVILLASFMPIISAISGNTGLQSAAIIIRGLSTGQVQLEHWKHAVARQLQTTAILGAVCALVLGTIGYVWEGRPAFGLTIFLGMFISVNIAGAVGTIIPLLSKRMGFDPALTAGPFETAFQDVIGISIFLGIATALLNWIK